MDNPVSNLDLFNEDHLPAGLPGEDPMEAIYALNIGDFVAESFISDDLLNKISSKLADDPQKLKAQLDELIHIYSIDKTLGILGLQAHDGFVIYDSIAATLVQMFQVDACHIFQIAQKETGEQYLSLTGTSQAFEGGQRWDIGVQVKVNDYLSDTFQGYDTDVVKDVGKLPNWHPIERLNQQKVKSVIATPLKEGSRALGLMVLESYTQTGFSEELIALADATARVFVTSLRLQQLVAQAQDKILEMQTRVDVNAMLNLRAQITESIADLGVHQQGFVEALSTAVDAREHFTRGHSQQVAAVAQGIAEELQLNEKTVDLIYLAGMLGSLGKVNIPKELMNKRGELSAEEWERLRDHPNVGVSLLVKINFMAEVVPYVHYQNERWDGSGKPEGLKGKSIPLGARILAVANAYFGMTGERPYRGESMSHVDALKTLRKEAGTKWDPLVVEALARMSIEPV